MLPSALHHLRLPGASSSPACSCHPCLRALGQAQTPGHRCWARWAGAAQGFNRTPPTPWVTSSPAGPGSGVQQKRGPGRAQGGEHSGPKVAGGSSSPAPHRLALSSPDTRSHAHEPESFRTASQQQRIDGNSKLIPTKGPCDDAKSISVQMIRHKSTKKPPRSQPQSLGQRQP